MPGQFISSPKVVRDFLQLRLNSCLAHEVFGIMYLNARNELIAYDKPFRSSLSTAPAYSREIVKIALAHRASASAEPCQRRCRAGATRFRRLGFIGR
ncbi:JAB domain-containing protein [Achromobacter kerstersii]|uniref:JAB domain-containing protein n=1 Tax=Achromobacter kerstersii TaxID=1353890 RepID=UPI0015831F3A